MRDHSGCIRGYHRSSKAWYAKSLKENIQVSFGMYGEDGEGTTGEMTMEWVPLNGKLCAQLQTFEDSWEVLSMFIDVIQKMGELNDQLPTEEQFCQLLDSCGFKDMTSYVRDTPEPQPDPEVTIKIPLSKAVDLGLKIEEKKIH
jgi:hypothetical protein